MLERVYDSAKCSPLISVATIALQRFPLRNFRLAWRVIALSLLLARAKLALRIHNVAVNIFLQYPQYPQCNERGLREKKKRNRSDNEGKNFGCEQTRVAKIIGEFRRRARAANREKLWSMCTVPQLSEVTWLIALSSASNYGKLVQLFRTSYASFIRLFFHSITCHFV